MSIEQDYVGATEAGEILGMTVSGVQYLRLAGKIKAVKVGRNWLYERASVEAYAAQRETDDSRSGSKKKN